MQKTYKVNCAWSIVVIIMIMFIIGNKDKIRWNIDNAWIMALVFLIGVEIVNVYLIISKIKIQRTSPKYDFDFFEELDVYKNFEKEKSRCEGHVGWNKYIKNKFKKRKNDKNFYYFMRRKLHFKLLYEKIMKLLIVSFVLEFMSLDIFQGSEEVKIIAYGISMIIVVAILTMEIIDTEYQISFIMDFLDIVFPTWVKSKKISITREK